MANALTLSVEQFREQHPSINADLVVEHARVALEKYHSSPAEFTVWNDYEDAKAEVTFANAESRSAESLEREDFVEKGAIVMAGLLLFVCENKQILRVSRRGSKVDYFVGIPGTENQWILEVSGTDEGNVEQRRKQKREQLFASPFRKPPYRMDGFVAVTRFAPDAVSLIESVSGRELSG